MRVVRTTTLSVTHADTLYIAQRIKRDLVVLSQAYPEFIDMEQVLHLYDAIVVFLMNDAVTRIGFSIKDPDQSDRVLYELRYEISYAAAARGEGAAGNVQVPGAIDASVILSVRMPSRARMTPWVVWSASMLARSPANQRQILQGTGWEAPGSSASKNRDRPTYAADPVDPTRLTYNSGSLAMTLQTDAAGPGPAMRPRIWQRGLWDSFRRSWRATPPAHFNLDDDVRAIEAEIEQVMAELGPPAGWIDGDGDA